MSQQVFADAYAGDPDIYVPNVVMATNRSWCQRVDGRHAAVEDHQRRQQGGTRPGRHPAGPVPVLRARRGPGCCTRTRTRGTSGCWTTAGWACSTSAPWTGCRAGCRRSSAGCSGSCTTTRDIGEVERELREHGFLRPGIDVDLERTARLPGAARRAVQGRVRSSSAANGCARRPPASPTCAPATSPAGSTCRRPTCSSTGCPRPASGCCASSSARASSGPRCSGGYLAISILPQDPRDAGPPRTWMRLASPG